MCGDMVGWVIMDVFIVVVCKIFFICIFEGYIGESFLGEGWYVIGVLVCKCGGLEWMVFLVKVVVFVFGGIGYFYGLMINLLEVNGYGMVMVVCVGVVIVDVEFV